MRKLLIILILSSILLPIYGQKEIITDKQIRFVENLDPSMCVKERDDKTPMALLHIEIPGLAEANITEENNFIKGEPIKTEYGWDLWITTKTRKNISLKIYTNQYKPLLVKSTEKLESGKKYELNAQLPPTDVNSGKVYVFLNVNEPCDLEIRNLGQIVDRISFTDNKLDTLLHLPYGKYTYRANATNRFEISDQLVLIEEPIEHSITMRSDIAKVVLYSDKGTKLLYDGQELVTVGDTTINEKNVGNKNYVLYEKVDKIGSEHIILLYRPEGQETKKISIQEGTNFYDLHLCGSLEITKPKNAYITINQDGKGLQFDKERMLSSALGSYTVNYSKYGFEPKTKTYNVGIRQNAKEGESLRRTIASFGFINYTYSPSAPIGLMFGYAKRWGVYGSIKTSQQFWKSFSLELGDVIIGHDDEYATSVNHSVKPEDWHNYYVDPNSLKKKDPYRFSASLGVMKSIAWWLYIYAGVGYGHYKTLYENPNPLISEKRYQDAPDSETYYKDKFFSTYDLKGAEVEGGIMLHHSGFNITAGWTHLIGSPTFGDFNVGIGINLHGKK